MMFQEGMHSVGVNTAEMRTIKRVLSAILHLGNISFKDNGEGQMPTVDGDKARQHMEWACELLGIDKVRALRKIRCILNNAFFIKNSFVADANAHILTSWYRRNLRRGCAAGKLDRWLFLARTQRLPPFFFAFAAHENIILTLFSLTNF